MRKLLFVAAVVMTCAGSAWAQGQPVVAVAAEGRSNFVVVDQVVLNLNAVAGINYAATSGGRAMISVTYLNGVTMTYGVKLTEDEWKRTQGEIVKAQNR